MQQFDLHETNTFLATYGWADLDPDLVLTVLRVTGGNPLFLGRVAVLGLDDRQAALPGGVHVAIHEASARLDAGARRILQVVAVLGLSPLVSEAAAVAETDPASVLDAVAEGTMAGLVTAEDPARFTYSHELVRSAFEHALPARERLDAHARAVLVVAGDERVLSPERSARSAHHALAAAPRSVGDARIAVSACRAAARSMVDSFAYEQADTLLSSAVDLHDAPGLGPAPAPLVVDWAQAALLCGRLAEARVRFERAATVARREGDAVRLAEAALGLGGHWLNERRAPVERARVLALQRSALAGLPESHESLRCRLVTRLTAEAVYDGGPLEPVHQALAAARECGDPLALAEGLSLTHHTMLAPDLARDRLALANELIGVASESGHEFLALMGLCWRAVDLFLLGDGRAGRALEDLRERADALMSQNILYIIEVLDVMRLIRAGRLDEAVAAAERCYELGIEVGEIDTLGYLCAHLLTIRWIQGRDSEVLELANEAATSPTLVQAEFGFKATAAALAAHAGDVEPARAALDHLASGGLTALPRSSTWLPGMVAIVEVAAVLRDVAVAEEAYELLRPFSDLPVMPSLAVVCLGSTERALGMASLTAGHRDRAIAHLERAVAANRLLQNRPLVAITRAELAAALDQRRRGDDRVRANELLEQAVLDAESMGMTARAAAWRRQLPQLAGGVLPEGPRADRADEAGPDRSPTNGADPQAGWKLAAGARRSAGARPRLGGVALPRRAPEPSRTCNPRSDTGHPRSARRWQRQLRAPRRPRPRCIHGTHPGADGRSGRGRRQQRHRTDRASTSRARRPRRPAGSGDGVGR